MSQFITKDAKIVGYNDAKSNNTKVEKFSKYRDLEIEVSKMWKMKATTLPVVIGALGVIEKGMRSTVEKNPRKTKFRRITEDHADGHCSHPKESSVD